MQEHPVPQNITAYEFHLIGSMTIKQFLILLVGAGLGLAVFTTNLPTIIKWPLIIIFVAAGIAMAFVPYEERTLDQWFVNFIRAIYRPTKYYWRRRDHAPSFFEYTAKSNQQILYQPDTAPLRKTRVQEYLSSLHQQPTEQVQDSLDLFQQDSSGVMSLFDQVSAASNVFPGSQEAQTRPNLQVRARPLGRTVVFAQSSAVPAAPAVLEPVSVTVETQEPQIPDSVEEIPETRPAQITDLPLVTLPVAEQTSTPLAAEPVAAAQQHLTEHAYVTPTAPPAPTEAPATDLPVIFNRELPFPTLPDKPNLLIGMVHSANKNIVPGAIVEILDETGNTVRAMKTNTLGQFYISSPLRPGKYRLETEHEGSTFPVYTFETNDTVLDPIDIQAIG